MLFNIFTRPTFCTGTWRQAISWSHQTSKSKSATLALADLSGYPEIQTKSKDDSHSLVLLVITDLPKLSWCPKNMMKKPMSGALAASYLKSSKRLCRRKKTLKFSLMAIVAILCLLLWTIVILSKLCWAPTISWLKSLNNLGWALKILPLFRPRMARVTLSRSFLK